MSEGAAALIERAWDARTDATRVKHARRAIAIDPDALDGYTLLGQSLPSAAERLALLREGGKRGRTLWARAMKAPARHAFWLDLDTRPFMRVLHLLALALWEAGEREAAIAEARTLLRLNRNDNQGIRELLAVWYAATGDWAALDKLLARYRDDWTTSQLYIRWLAAFHRGEDTAAALAEAMEVNPHVPAALADPDFSVDEDEGPLGAMGYVTMGSAAEAIGYAGFARPAWQAVPGAVERLAADARVTDAHISSGDERPGR